MTATLQRKPGPASQLVNLLLSVRPLASWAKRQARQTIVRRAEKTGVPWRQAVATLRQENWDAVLQQVADPAIAYPDYYLRAFHAYDEGNLCWQAAWEQEVAARAVHANIWPEAGVQGDDRLRQSYHQVLQECVAPAPKDILDVGCGVGLSAFAIQQAYPEARVTGLDLSPYFLAIADYKTRQRDAVSSTKINTKITWQHAAAEATGLPDASFDLVSFFLVFHELPQHATRKIFCEARRLLRPGGYLALMDMNPRSEIRMKMPPYILTLLKSTEPYLDEFFSLDIAGAIVEAGFHPPTVVRNSPRHHALVARAATRAPY